MDTSIPPVLPSGQLFVGGSACCGTRYSGGTTMHWGLSARLRSCWAKSDDEQRSLSLVAHGADSSAVAGYLFDNWLPRSVRRLVADGRTDDEARALVQWLAASHDVGKASPAFACQVEYLANAIRDTGLPLDINPHESRRRDFPHSVVSHLSLEHYLAARGWSDTKVNRAKVSRSYAVVAGGHHGVPPGSLKLLDRDPAMTGGHPWDAVRNEFLDFTTQISGADRYLDSWSRQPLTPAQQVLLTGIVIVADWLASNTGLFPLDVPRDASSHAVRAMERLALPPPWSASPITDVREAFGRFGLPSDATPNAMQEETVQMARKAGSHGLIIVEGPMGSGKTEAALMAAQQFASAVGAGGVFFALPTMATANAMFARDLNWLRSQPGLGVTSAVLAHSKADLNDDFRGLVTAGFAADVDRDGDSCEATVIAHQWLSGRKRGLLANFVVGTIDQLLFMALQARHLALRHLAFAGKVIVIDEVHAADTYMREYLIRALEWLGAYQVPVIMLSATLPVEQRLAYVEAYGRGLQHQRYTPEELSTEQYPAVTGVLSTGEACVSTPAICTPSKSVRLIRVSDDVVTLVGILTELLADGGCAAVIRNTVRRAQETARALREIFGDEVRLLHSSFIAQHRAELETELLEELGRTSPSRPRRRIVVATQVVEQSLDVDFDLMITDVAPIDLILQRLGRLHRHERDRGNKLQKAQLFMTGVVDWSSVVPQPVSASMHVYRPYDLFRALAILDGRNSIQVPSEIAPLVHRGYDPHFAGPAGWEADIANAKCAAEREDAALRQAADAFRVAGPRRKPTLVGWLDNGGDDPENPKGYARVRNSNDSVEVVVTVRRNNGVYLPLRPAHRAIAVNIEPDDESGLLARQSTIKLPYILCVPGRINAVIEELESRTCRYPGWRASKWLKGELALELNSDLTTELCGFHIRYDDHSGLVLDRCVDG